MKSSGRLEALTLAMDLHISECSRDRIGLFSAAPIGAEAVRRHLVSNHLQHLRSFYSQPPAPLYSPSPRRRSYPRSAQILRDSMDRPTLCLKNLDSLCADQQLTRPSSLITKTLKLNTHRISHHQRRAILCHIIHELNNSFVL